MAPTPQQTATDQDALESLLDRHNLTGILNMLTDICSGKADHLRSAWQDESAAKEWDRAAKVCNSACARANRLIL